MLPLSVALFGCDGGVPAPEDTEPPAATIAAADASARAAAHSSLVVIRKAADALAEEAQYFSATSDPPDLLARVDVHDRLVRLHASLAAIPEPRGDPRARAMRAQVAAVLSRLDLTLARWPLPKDGIASVPLDEAIVLAQLLRRESAIHFGPAQSVAELSSLLIRCRGLQTLANHIRPKGPRQSALVATLRRLAQEIEEAASMHRQMLADRRASK